MRARGLLPASARECLALLAVLFAMALLVQGPTVNASSHHALVRALAEGTPRIDETRGEIGDVGTTDVAWYEGHAYSNKAPALAVATLPVYLVLDAAGQTSRSDPAFVLWALGLVGLVLPAGLLLLLVRYVVERLRPGLGTPIAVVVGLGTPLLPFSTLFYAHVLSATLGFGAFALLWYERRREPSLLLVALAGGLCALAATAEHPVGLVWLVLLPYVAVRAGGGIRVASFAAGALAGIVPQLAYNWWALGSPFRLAYRYGVFSPGASGRDVLQSDVPFSEVWSLPSVDALVSLPFATWGLVTAAPIVALVPVGAVLLYRSGKRAEALIPVAVLGLFYLYSACYYAPFGDTWSPRYLVAAIPFLALPIAAASAAYPLVAAVLGACSIAMSVAVTATHPMAAGAWSGGVLDRLLTWPFDGHSPTVIELAGLVAWWDTLPFFAAALLAGGFAALELVRRAGSRELPTAIATFVGWAAFARFSPRLAVEASDDADLRALFVLGLAAVVVALVLAVRRVSARIEPARAGRAY